MASFSLKSLTNVVGAVSSGKNAMGMAKGGLSTLQECSLRSSGSYVVDLPRFVEEDHGRVTGEFVVC